MIRGIFEFHATQLEKRVIPASPEKPIYQEGGFGLNSRLEIGKILSLSSITNMKTCLLGLAATIFFAPFVHSAVMFSGGHDGIPVTLTITEDIVIPINQESHTTVVTMILKGAYEEDSSPFRAVEMPQTLYPESNSIKAQLRKEGGITIDASGYNVWGKSDEAFGDLGLNDFFGTFDFASPDYAQIEPGDSFIIKAGSIVFSSLVLAPNAEPFSIVLIDDFGSALNIPVNVPEPSVVILGVAGNLLLLRRKR